MCSGCVGAADLYDDNDDDNDDDDDLLNDIAVS